MNSQKQKDEAINIICSNEIMSGILAENYVSGRILSLNSFDSGMLEQTMAGSFIILRTVLTVKAWAWRN